jgi:hypothetical protein
MPEPEFLLPKKMPPENEFHPIAEKPLFLNKY